MAPTTDAVSNTELLHRVESIDARMEKIESKLDQIVSLDRTIAELNVHRERSAEDSSDIWKRIDQIGHWRDIHERESREQHDKVISVLEANRESFTKTCNTIEGKVDGWINRGKGAVWAAAFFITILQACVLGSITWTFQHVNSLEDQMIQIQSRLSTEESQPHFPLSLEQSKKAK